MRTPKRVLIVDGESCFSQSVVWCLAAARSEVHILSSDPRAPVRGSRYVSSFRTYQPSGESTLVEQVAERMREVQADVSLCVDTRAIRRFASASKIELAAVRCAPLPPVAPFDAASDKMQFAEALREHGLPHPSTVLCRADDDVEALRAAVTFPVLLKPRVGGNGNGIRRFRTPDDLVAYRASHPEICDAYIVQSEREGSDIDCSVLCANGRIVAYTMQRPLRAAAVKFRPAGAIEFVFDPRVLEVVARMVAALNWNGVAHVDLRDTVDGRIEIIEVNPRFWGSVLGSLHAGINFPDLACQAGLGVEVGAYSYALRRYAGGSAALESCTNIFRRKARNGVPLRDTALAHVVKDPWPNVLELAANAGLWGSLSRLASRKVPN